MNHHFAPGLGDDSSAEDIPRLGDLQGILDEFASSRKRRILAGARLGVYKTEVLTAALAISASGLASLLVARGLGLGAPWWGLGVLACFSLAAEQQPVRFSSRVEITVSVFPVVFAAVAFGPLAAMLVSVVGLVGQFQAPYLRWLLWTSGKSLAAGLSGLGAMAVADGSRDFASLAASVVLALVIEAAVDGGIGVLTFAVRRAGRWQTLVASTLPMFAVTVPLYGPVLTLLVYAYMQLSAWSLLLFLVPTFAAHSLYRLYREQQRAVGDLRDANRRLEDANLSFAEALIAALDARDRYTAGHSAAVARYAREIAREMGFSTREQELAHLCGLVHDIGKVGLPPGILEKEGSLTADERLLMQGHPAIGERILSKVDGYAEIAKIVRHHHERVDGAGYPDRIAGEEIPPMSRILAVADAYDAMTSARPYRGAMPREVACARLRAGAGTQFDESIVAAFERSLPSRNASDRDDAELSLTSVAPALVAATA